MIKEKHNFGMEKSTLLLPQKIFRVYSFVSVQVCGENFSKDFLTCTKFAKNAQPIITANTDFM